MIDDFDPMVQGKIKDWDLFYQKSISSPIIFENNQLKTIEENFFEGLGLRIIHKDKIGFSSTTNLLNQKGLADNALETALLGEKAFFQISDQKIDKKDLNTYSTTIEDLNSQIPMEWGKMFIEEMLSLDSKLKVNVSIEKNIIEKKLLNSKGLNLQDKKSLLSLMVSFFKAEENNFLEVYDYKSYTHIPDKNEVNSLLDNVKRLYHLSVKQKEIKSGYYQVYFTPKAFSTLLSLFLQSFDGKLFEKKVSYFYDKLNQPFIPQNIDIIDDPYVKGFPYSHYFDGDGLGPEKIYLLQEGIVKNYIVDAQTAGKLNVISNGHSARDYGTLPIPGFTNVLFQTNDKSLLYSQEEILQNMEKGIIVDQLLGAGQSNVLGGEFSGNIDLGFLVEHGEIVGRIKDCMMTGNFFQFFNNILKIENKNYRYSRYFIPSILFEKISVSAKH